MKQWACWSRTTRFHTPFYKTSDSIRADFSTVCVCVSVCVSPCPCVYHRSAKKCICLCECVCMCVLGSHFPMHKPWQVSRSTWTELGEEREWLVLSYQLNPLSDSENNMLREFYVLLRSCFLMVLKRWQAPQVFLIRLANRYYVTQAEVHWQTIRKKACLHMVRQLSLE